jgi:hypothetical protein
MIIFMLLSPPEWFLVALTHVSGFRQRKRQPEWIFPVDEIA